MEDKRSLKERRAWVRNLSDSRLEQEKKAIRTDEEYRRRFYGRVGDAAYYARVAQIYNEAERRKFENKYSEKKPRQRTERKDAGAPVMFGPPVAGGGFSIRLPMSGGKRSRSIFSWR